MHYHTRIRVFVEGSPDEPIACAIVHLCDRDRFTRDDHLGMDITNTFGEAAFSFTDEDFLDIDDLIGGALPELYVKVFDRHGGCAYSTRAAAVRNTVPEMIEVRVPRELARRHELI